MRVIQIIVIAIILLIETTLYAQILDTLWTRTFGGVGWDDGHSLVLTDDGGCVFVGTTNSFGAGGYDVYMIKVDRHGNTVWTRTYGTSADEYGNSITGLFNHEGYAIAGYQGHYPLHCEVYFLKTDRFGNLNRTETYGCCFAKSIIQTSDGGFAIIGRSPWSFYLVKTDSLGDSLWTDIYYEGYNNSGLDIVETPSNGYIMVGCTGEGDGVHSWDFYLVETNSEGFIFWTARYGDSTYTIDDWASSIIMIQGRKFIVCGTTMTYGSGRADFWLMSIDRFGQIIWDKTYGGAYNDIGYSAIQTWDDGYILVGFTDSFGAGGHDVYIVRTNEVGDTLCTKTVGGSNDDIAREIVTTGKDEYYIVGYTESFGAGYRDIYLIKLRETSTDINNDKDNPIPENIAFLQNYPNPFNVSTSIKYHLDKTSRVDLVIYNLIGQQIVQLGDETQQAGEHSLIWNADELPSGIYFASLKAGEKSASIRMLLLK